MRVLLLAVGKTPLRYDENPYFFEYLIDKDDNQEIDIVTFGYNEGLDIRISPQDDFDSVINRLPDGWYPDCCILQAIDNNLLPRGIEKAPFLVVAIPLPGDWDLDLPYVKAIIDAVDLVIGEGFFDEENYPVLGANDVEIFYIGSVMASSFDPQPKKIKDRPIDIFYTASWLNNLSRPERSQWAAKLVDLSKKHNLVIETWSKSYGDYLTQLRNSKLAFSHVRQVVFSNRVFEAASQGTVSVVTGRDAKRYFEDGKEIISVSDDISDNDLFDKVDHYLQNETLLQEMSINVYENVRKNFESKSRYLRLLEIIDKKYMGKKINRKVHSLSPLEQHIRSGEIYYYAYCRGALEGFGYWFANKNSSVFLGSSIEEFAKAVNIHPSPRAKTNLAVASSAFMFEKNNREITLEESQNIISILKDVISAHPEYVMAHFNLGLFYFRISRDEDSMSSFTEAVNLLENGTGDFDPWCLQNRDYDTYKLLLKKPFNETLLFLMKEEPGSLKKLANLIQYASLYFISLIHESRGDLYNSLEALQKSYDLYDEHPLIVKKIAQLLGLLGYRKECLEMFEKVTEIMPVEMDLRREKINYLYLYEEDAGMMREISEFKKLAMGIRTLNDKMNILKSLMNSFGRFHEKDSWIDFAREDMLNSMAHVIYTSLKKKPRDIRLIVRITEIWNELGKFDSIFELIEDYLNNVKEIDSDTLLILGDIYKLLEDSTTDRRRLYQRQLAALPDIGLEVST